MDAMGAIGAYLDMKQANIMTNIGAKLLGQNLDTMKDMGQGVSNMINAAPSPSLESLVNPAIGGNIDILV